MWLSSWEMPQPVQEQGMSVCGLVTTGSPQKAQAQLRGSRQLTSLWRGPHGPTPPKTDPVLSHSCQCREYISAEELCDAQCLARAARLSLAWGPSRKLILSMKDEAAGSIQRVSPAQGRIGMEGQFCPLEKERWSRPGLAATENSDTI